MQDIDTIISDCNDQINDKIFGINYLEKLKYLLIDRMKNYEIISIDNLVNIEISKKFSENQLLINFENYPNSISKIKTDVSHDYLCIVLRGNKVLKVFNNIDSITCNELVISKNTGIVLTKKTIIDELIAKNTLLMNVYYINNSENNSEI